MEFPFGERIWGGGGRIAFREPPLDAEGIEIEISNLYVARFGGGEIVTLPRPKIDEPMDLAGVAFDSSEGPVELVEWKPNHGSHTLVLRPPSPDWCPDVRVLHGNESVSLWTHLGPNGTVRATLPDMLNEAFEEPRGLRVALRMIAKPAPPVRISARLTTPGAGSA